jgi:hypothetical protein
MGLSHQGHGVIAIGHVGGEDVTLELLLNQEGALASIRLLLLAHASLGHEGRVPARNSNGVIGATFIVKFS